MRTRRGRSEYGFSVLEAVIALGIIATGVLAMTGLALRTTDAVVRARHRSVAVQLADAGLTELAARGVPPSGAACLLSDVAGCVEYRDAAASPAPGPAGAFAVRWLAAAVPGGPSRRRFSPCAPLPNRSARPVRAPPVPVPPAC